MGILDGPRYMLLLMHPMQRIITVFFILNIIITFYDGRQSEGGVCGRYHTRGWKRCPTTKTFWHTTYVDYAQTVSLPSIHLSGKPLTTRPLYLRLLNNLPP
jgi:hypothetical protein